MTQTSDSAQTNNHQQQSQNQSQTKNDQTASIDADIMQEWQKNALLWSEKCNELMSKYASETSNFNTQDTQNLIETLSLAGQSIMANPEKLLQAQLNWWNTHLSLMQNTFTRFWGAESPAVIEPKKDDKRFRDTDWQDHHLFDFMKQSYLLTERWIDEVTNNVDGLDTKSKAKLDFYARQISDALSPTNFAVTNPRVLRETFESKGENLVRGLENMMQDFNASKENLRISMCDPNAFTLGEDIATTKGYVVHQNQLMQLIHYEPTTKQVYEIPLLILPPWINKYYILDLKQENSFIRWCLDQGFSVYVVSWVNPDEKHRDIDFVDYMKQGILENIDFIKQATKTKKVNLLGYCLGGTLLAMTLAWMAKKKDESVHSATFLTTMLDFSNPGDLGVFIDKKQVDALEAKMSKSGYLDGNEMANTFSMLRPNDLIWHFVINNYLLGKEPKPFDLLYWNGDSTRMPAKMHSFYLRNMYLENNLAQPGKLVLDGVKINLNNIKQPAFMLSTMEDHIAPWKSTFQATQLIGDNLEFVLAGSGHIAGVVNPPKSKKYCYWKNLNHQHKDADQWFNKAERIEGSWWGYWSQWLKKYAGKKNPAKQVSEQFKIYEPAPGSYVLKRFE